MASISLIKKYPGVSAFLAFEFAALLIVSYQIQVDARISLLEKVGLILIGPIQTASHSALDSVSNFRMDRRTKSELLQENDELKRHLAGFEETKGQLVELELQNTRLRQLLLLPEPEAWSQVAAEVIGRTKRRNDYLIIISRGTQHGIGPDMGVYCPQGVVGVVWEASTHYAKVMTINNPGSVVAGLVQRSRYLESFVVGQVGGIGRLENYPNFEPIQIGDTVLTSGLDGVFPKGSHIGTVVRAMPSANMFQDVGVRFSTDFSRLEEVMVLIPEKRGAEDALE